MVEGCPPLDINLKGWENPGGGAVLGAALGTASDQPGRIDDTIEFLAI